VEDKETTRVRRSPLYRLAGLALLGVAIGGGVLLIQQSGDHPRIEIESSSINFGVVSPGAKASRQIEVRNTGRKPLAVVDVKMTCGCTEAAITKSIIEPGDSATLTVAAHGRATRGPSRESLTVISNDPKRPVVDIVLEFMTGGDAFIEPSSLDFGRVSREELPKELGATFHFSEEEKTAHPSLGSLRVVSSDTSVVARLEETDSPDTRRIVAVLSPAAPAGQFRSMLTVSDDRHKYSMSVHGYVRGRIYAVPNSLVIGPVGRDPQPQDHLTTVSIRRRNGPLTPLRAELSDSLRPILAVEVLPEELRLRLRPPAGRMLGTRVDGTILVQAAGPESDGESIRIPVSVFYER